MGKKTWLFIYYFFISRKNCKTRGNIVKSAKFVLLHFYHSCPAGQFWPPGFMFDTSPPECSALYFQWIKCHVCDTFRDLWIYITDSDDEFLISRCILTVKKGVCVGGGGLSSAETINASCVVLVLIVLFWSFAHQTHEQHIWVEPITALL